ncbi:MAG: sugar ABC transporter ATP-binding protein [Gemmatimonadaceae bacterium]|nr:sugar ABC transporter ATP-binding protein [Gemmatimonadaceae bacterium]
MRVATAVPAARDPAVRFEGISKRFPGVLALDGVSVEIAAGTCHALCGENGAGKSTLGKVLAGLIVPDGGTLFVHGREMRFSEPRDALAHGVAMVHQELACCENMTVAENLCLGALPSRFGIVDDAGMARRARELLAETGTTLNVRQRLGELSIGQRQMVQIAAALGAGARVIVFDEPTSSLSGRDAEQLFALVRRLTARGVTCIYVSHRMPEIFSLCDAVSVLRDGRLVDTRSILGLTEQELVAMMIGRPLATYEHRREAKDHRDELLRADGLSVTGSFEDVSLVLHAGEVVGLAGLMGAGRSEVARALFGLDRVTRGVIRVAGDTVRVRDPHAAIALGIAFVPEDRKLQGLVLSESVLRNASLPTLSLYARWSWIDRVRERRDMTMLFDRLRVRAPNVDSAVAGLSGGNQQKIVLAKWLAAKPRILMLDEPTRGVDVGAKAEIHAMIGELAASGMAILLISSELSELLALADRILVLREGRTAGEIPRAQATEEGLLRMMAGAEAMVNIATS